MKGLVTSRAWWRAAGIRVARTALAALAATLPVITRGDTQSLILAGSTVALAAIASLATSLAGLPEVVGKGAPWWQAALTRAAKSFGQLVVVATASAAVWADVAWSTVLVQAVIAAVVSLLLSAVEVLPEAQADAYDE